MYDHGMVFGKHWWASVLEAWNLSAYRPSLENLGTVCFEVNEGPSVFVHWDVQGFGTVLDEEVSQAPRFKASEQQWEEFVRRQFSAVAGVMLGHIEFHGAVSAILPYSDAFNHLADIANEVHPHLNS
jgi:hypothetical protein